MTGSHDHYLMFRIGQIHTMVKQIHTQVCASKTSQPSKTKAMLLEFGRAGLKAVMPLLTPYILAFLTGLGAMIVTAWKAFTRGWFGF